MTKKKKIPFPGQYLVIPLNLTAKPFATDNIEAYRSNSHYIVRFDSLKEYDNIPDDIILDLEYFIAAHFETENKIQIKDMGKYGAGAFSKAVISEGDKLIYSGLMLSMSEREDHEKYINNQHMYTYLPSKYSKSEIFIDGNFNNCISKYFQHMPSNSYITNDGKVSCHANFEVGNLFCRVRIYGMRLNVPIIILRATRTIPDNKLIAFDYGDSYWLKRTIPPTFFTEDGEPLNSYHFYCNSKPQIIEQSFSADVLDHLLKVKYHIDDSLITIYPPESIRCINAEKGNATDGAVRVKVPAIVSIEIDDSMMTVDHLHTGYKLFLLPIKHCDVELNDFIQHLTIGAAEMGGVLRFSLIVERIANLTANEWLYLADFLNKIVIKPVHAYISEDFKELNALIVQEEKQIPLYSLAPTNFFKKVAGNFNDRFSVLESITRSDDKRRNNSR